MKDPLTLTLPDGWRRWAESNETRLLGIGVLLALNFYISIRIGRFADYNRKEKQFWILVVWAFPIMGAVWALHTASQIRKCGQKQRPASDSEAS
jgi:hypothetical protein